MISGAPYAEDRENRRRQRHAVTSALTENDYVPADAGRLGYFTLIREYSAANRVSDIEEVACCFL